MNDYTPTLADARKWQTESEKYTFCIELLGLRASQATADSAVERLEDAFDALLAGHATEKEADALLHFGIKGAFTAIRMHEVDGYGAKGIACEFGNIAPSVASRLIDVGRKLRDAQERAKMELEASRPSKPE